LQWNPITAKKAVSFDGVVKRPIYALHPKGTSWGRIWTFLLSTPRAFPAGTINVIFYEFINFGIMKWDYKQRWY